MKDFATRKSSNEHGFFVVVTSMNKIGEGRIRDLTGDIPFLLAFKYPVQRHDKGEIFVETVTQFPIYVELYSTSLQLSGPFRISNCPPTPGVVILGLLNVSLSSPVKMAMEMMLQVGLLLELMPAAPLYSSY